MKRHQLRLALVVFALFGFGVFASPSWAITANWTNAAATNAWETAGNWNINQVPNNNTFDITIPIAAPCNLSSGFQIGALNLSVSPATLNLVPGSTIAIASATGLNNNGTIVVNTTGANTTTTLRFDVSCPVTGTGSILLNGFGSTFNVADFNLNGQTVTIGAGQTIHGHGTILSNTGLLINNGTINGDDAAGGNMQLDLVNNFGFVNQNNGTLKATNGGVLGLYSGLMDQTGGGSFLADGNGSIVQLGGGGLAQVVGGTLNTANNGVIQITGAGAILSGSTNNGAIQIPGGNNPLVVTGTGLTNNGTILVDTTGANLTAKIRFDADGTLGGTGSILLNGFGSNFNVADLDLGGHTVTIGAGQTIHGHGTILSNTGLLINNGTINGDDAAGGNMQVDLTNNFGFVNQNNGTLKATNGGVLGLYSGLMDQTGGGSFLADGNGSIVQLGGGGLAQVVGGTLNTANNGVIQITGAGAILSGSTNNGAIQIPGGNNPLVVTGTGLTNNGTILVDAAADNLTTRIRFDADGTLGGTGSVTLNGIINIFDVAGFDCNGHSIINGPNHTIKGNGDIFVNGGALTNNGTIAPGLSAGQLNVNGHLQLGSTSNLSFEIGGTTPATQYDVLNKADATQLALAGTLSVRLINGFTPTAGNTFTILTTQTAVSGAFSNVASGQRLSTADGSGSFIVTYSGNNVVLSSFQAGGQPTPTPTPRPGTLANISTRLQVGTADRVMIAGFIVQGSAPKRVLIRAAGPSLTQFGVPNALANPRLELHDTNNTIGMNDNWQTTQIGGVITSDQVAEIQNSGLAPRDPLESALIATLPPGTYTAIVQGVGGGTGVGIVEAYDLDAISGSLLANISTRGFVQIADNVMIGGFIIVTQPTRVIIRAIGPSLTQFGVPDALANPQLELHDANNIIARNDDWQTTQIFGIITSDQVAAIQNSQLAPTNPFESAIIATLQPGNYTAIVRGVNSTTGNALVEVYNLQ